MGTAYLLINASKKYWYTSIEYTKCKRRANLTLQLSFIELDCLVFEGIYEIQAHATMISISSNIPGREEVKDIAQISKVSLTRNDGVRVTQVFI